MLPDLPPPDKRHLPRSPLLTTVCQIKFEEIAAVGDARTLLNIQNELGGRSGEYPRSEQLVGPAVTIRQPGNAILQPSIDAQHGWRLSSSDGVWTITLMPDSVALETTRYTTWAEDFHARFKRVLNAVARCIAPSTEQRLGLRYVNQISQPPIKAPYQWKEYIAPELLGAVLHDHLGPRVAATQQQIDLDCGDEVKCSVRHGFADSRRMNNSFVYLIDTDVYREAIREFDPADIEAATIEFNDIALQIFQQSITPHLFDVLSVD